MDQSVSIVQYAARWRICGPGQGSRAMSAQRSILIVEDGETLREILAEQLAYEHGFAVSTAGTLDAADRAIRDEGSSFDAVILDLGLPDGNGCDYCAKLRRQGHKMPVIMLTGSFGES